MKTGVTVSVIVPCYNHKRFLEQRLDSIFRQTYPDFEVILLDDCSTDGSQELLRFYAGHPKVSHVVQNEANTGSPFAQWEKGIGLAVGKYVWIAESDDYADADFLKYTVPEMEKHPEAAICYTGSYLVDADGNRLEEDMDVWAEDGKVYVYESIGYLHDRMFTTNSTYNASMILFRRADCLRGINETYNRMRYCGDWLFWIDQIRKGREVLEVRRKLNCFRQHAAGTTIKSRADYASISEVLFILDYLCRLAVITEDEKIIRQEDIYQHIRHSFAGTKERKKEITGEILPQYGFTKEVHEKGKELSAGWFSNRIETLLEEAKCQTGGELDKSMTHALSVFNSYVNVAGFWKHWEQTKRLRRGFMAVLASHEDDFSPYVARRIRKINNQWPLFYWIHWGRKSLFG